MLLACWGPAQDRIFSRSSNSVSHSSVGVLPQIARARTSARARSSGRSAQSTARVRLALLESTPKITRNHVCRRPHHQSRGPEHILRGQAWEAIRCGSVLQLALITERVEMKI